MTSAAACKKFAAFLRGSIMTRQEAFDAYLAVIGGLGTNLITANTWTITGPATMAIGAIADELDALGDQLETNVPVHFHSAADIEAQIKHHAKLAMVAKQQQHQDHNAEEAKKFEKLRVSDGSAQVLPELAPNLARLCEGMLSGTLYGLLPAAKA
jgi:hypothetical protein